MDEEEIRNLYNFMLENGELFEMMSSAKGVYEEDKKRFLDIMSKML
jgi:hypothetical protein